MDSSDEFISCGKIRAFAAVLVTLAIGRCPSSVLVIVSPVGTLTIDGVIETL